jgi:hypothetical protein
MKTRIMKKFNAFSSFPASAVLLIILVFLSSCSTVYVPNSQSVPLFEEKKQAVVMGALAVGDQSTGADIQAAYAVTDHFAVMGNAYFGQVVEDWITSIDSNTTTFAGENVPYRNFELAVGYFTKLGTSDGIFEVYGGWGFGGPRNTIESVREFYRNNHFFVQPNIGGRLGAVDVAFSTRINYVLWPEFSEVFFEPAFTLRFGWEKVKFQVQGLISVPFDGYGDDLLPSDISADFPAYEFFHTSFGIYFPLDFN